MKKEKLQELFKVYEDARISAKDRADRPAFFELYIVVYKDVKLWKMK